MITTQLINSDASLNNFFEIGSVRYSAGENVTVAFRLKDEQRGIRFIPDAAATINVYYTDNTNTEIAKAASVIDADDRSMWKVSFTQAETAVISSSTLRAEVDALGDATVIYIDMMINVLAKQVKESSC